MIGEIAYMLSPGIEHTLSHNVFRTFLIFASIMTMMDGAIMLSIERDWCSQ